MLVLQKSEGGSISSTDGNILYVSAKDFEEKILRGDHCFLCCRSTDAGSSKEHIFPNWILKRFDLHAMGITLPNGTSVTYGSYTIPCCEDCNSFLGNLLEKKFSTLTERGIEAVNDLLLNDGPWLILIWLSLMFFKTHFKDFSYRKHLDRRKGEEKIGDAYTSSDFHHIYNVIRTIKNGVALDRTALSSIYVLPLKDEQYATRFDYMDIYPSQSIYLKLDTICLIGILNDGCGVLSTFLADFKKMSFPISYIQSREMFAHLSYLSQTLNPRPEFRTKFDEQGAQIEAEIREFVEVEPDQKKFGEILHYCCWPVAKAMGAPQEVEEHLRSGRYTWLKDVFQPAPHGH